MTFNYKTEFERYKRYYQNLGTSVAQPKTQAYTTAIFSFLAVSLFGWYAIRPTASTILFLQKEIADDQVVNQQMEDKISKLIASEATLEQYQNELPLLAEALPHDPAAVNLVAALRNLGMNAGASVSAISLAKVPLVSGAASSSAQTAGTALSTLPNQKIIDLPITIMATGNFASLKKFLTGITNLRRIISITSLDIAPDSAANANLTNTTDLPLHMVVRLTAHYLQ